MFSEKWTIGRVRLIIFVIGTISIVFAALIVWLGNEELTKAAVPILLVMWLITVGFIALYFLLLVKSWLRK